MVVTSAILAMMVVMPNRAAGVEKKADAAKPARPSETEVKKKADPAKPARPPETAPSQATANRPAPAPGAPSSTDRALKEIAGSLKGIKQSLGTILARLPERDDGSLITPSPRTPGRTPVPSRSLTSGTAQSGAPSIDAWQNSTEARNAAKASRAGADKEKKAADNLRTLWENRVLRFNEAKTQLASARKEMHRAQATAETAIDDNVDAKLKSSLESDASQRAGGVRNLDAKHKQEFLAIQADAKKLMEQVKKASDSEADAQYGQLILHYHDLVGTISGDMLASPQ
ncbi:MAG: hypothetical protein WKF75_11300 [Singulisphaera sp.]